MRYLPLVAVWAITQQLSAQVGGPVSRAALAGGSYAITNVNVVPMTSETLIRNATVVVRDGRISVIGPASRAQVPANARRIDGSGKYLIPGLVDMHTHLYSDGDVPDSAAPAELGVMLANGITAVRLMMGTPEQVQLRSDVMAGTIVGPQLWLASPMFTSRPGENARVVTTPEQVRAAVRAVKAEGYDFIKVTFGITGALYDALVDESKRVGIPIVGHVEPEVGVLRAIAVGQQIEHLDAYFEAALADHAPMRVSLTQGGVYRPENWESIDYIDDQKLTALAQATARGRIWSGPTLEVFNRAFSIPLSDEELQALPDWNMIPNQIRTPYVNSRKRYWSAPVTPERRKRYAEIRNTLVKRIVDAGGRILAGSDTPDLLMAYGFTLHRELQALVRAGLTPYQALQAATRNPAEYLGATREWGTIEVGKRADFVLLAGSPLEDIRNTERIEAVGIGGRWFDRGQLDAMIEAGTRAINGAPPTQAAAWTTGPPILHTRAAHAVVATASGIYAFAGSGAGSRPVMEAERFDGNSWSVETTIPEGLNAPTASAIGDRIYLIGGFSGVSNLPTDQVHIYDTRSKKWSAGAPLPAPRGGHAAVVLNGRIHVFGGGNNRSTIADHSVYDPATNTWTERAPLPRAEGSPAGVVFDGKVWAIGGRSGPSDFGDVYLYDATANRWTSGPSIEPRGTAGAVVFAGTIWLLGGESQAKQKTLNSVLRLDANRSGWTEAPPMPTARNYARAVVFRNAIWTVGGSPSAGASHSSTGSTIVERLIPH